MNSFSLSTSHNFNVRNWNFMLQFWSSLINSLTSSRYQQTSRSDSASQMWSAAFSAEYFWFLLVDPIKPDMWRCSLRLSSIFCHFKDSTQKTVVTVVAEETAQPLCGWSHNDDLIWKTNNSLCTIGSHISGAHLLRKRAFQDMFTGFLPPSSSLVTGFPSSCIFFGATTKDLWQRKNAL